MKTFLLLIAILLIGLLIYLFIAPLFENPDCDLDTLLLKDDILPEGWQKLWKVLPPALPKDGAKDAVNLVFENGSNISQHGIYQYFSGSFAYFFLRFNKEIYFPSTGWKWSQYSTIEDWQLHADEGWIMCGNSSDTLLSTRCSAVLRYGPFISDISVPIIENIMDQQQFQAIVIDVDKHFVSCNK